MNLQRGEKEYLELDLYELARQIRSFLDPYPFVEAAYLYHGADKPKKYRIIFVVPPVPEGSGEIQVKKPDEERIKEFFKIAEVEEETEKQKDMAGLYDEFCEKVLWPVFYSLELDEVYRRKRLIPETLGSSPHGDGPEKEWQWEIVDRKYKILSEIGPDLRRKNNVYLRDLVFPGEPVRLYTAKKGVEATPPGIGRTDSPEREDKEGARMIADRYINDCKNLAPSIKEAVDKVKMDLTKGLYQDQTIHNWIMDLFPPESRKPGRRPKKPQ